MPRRKPASAKQKKAQLQEKRAVKRGDPHVEADSSNIHGPAASGAARAPHVPPSKTHLSRSGRTAHLRPGAAAADHARAASRALTSEFVRVGKEFGERAKRQAEEERVGRPVEGGVARWSGVGRGAAHDAHQDARLAALAARLTVPRRPKWRRKAGAEGITKKELERNEAGAFARWEAEVGGVVQEWEEGVCGGVGGGAGSAFGDDGGEGEGDTSAGPSSPRAQSPAPSPPLTSRLRLRARSRPRPPAPAPLHIPTTYETNLEVYRQLWRVTERSDVVLALADVRCPPVGFSSAMRGWLREVAYGRAGAEGGRGLGRGKTRDGDGAKGTRRDGPSERAGAGAGGDTGKRVVLVLTKTDLVSAACRDGWVRWCKAWWRAGAGGQEEADEQDIDVVCVESYDTTALNEGPRHQHKHIPHIPPASLAGLVAALERAHASLVASRRDVKRRVEWTRLLRGDAANGNAVPAARDGQEGLAPPAGAQERGSSDREEPGFVTIGLIGQPNVGKSSLLNALVGQTKVKASKTPGKTKHFQTIFWNDEVRIVDCPGLVVPNLIGFDMQVMAGVLQISQIPSLAACISHVARLMPLEEILRLPPPAKWAEDAQARRDVESKKTYRKVDLPATSTQAEADSFQGEWTPYLIMEGWALDRGFLTAKAGRPDVNRAVMRMVAEGRIPWTFWAPDTSDSDLAGQAGRGVWTGGDVATDVPDGPADSAADQEEESDEEMVPTDDETSSEVTISEESEAAAHVTATSRFAALELDDDDDSSEEDSGEETVASDT